MYLVGDIGGTKTNIAILDFTNGNFKTVFEKSFLSKDYDSLRTIVKKVYEEDIRGKFTITKACFGVAGPVKNGKCDATNLPWLVDAKKIAEVLTLENNVVFLLNDLEAAAYGIDCLTEKDIFVLNEGEEQKGGTRCLISAGTGLGESIIVHDGKNYRPIPSEGGHSDFAPRNKIEMDLLEDLMAKYGRISYERVLSGPGLANAYEFFKKTSYQDISAWLSERIKEEDPSAVISEVAMSRKDEACEKALDLFVSVYGAEAGNLALKSLSTGGVYIGGGIAPKILDKIKEGSFMQSFTNKGRLAIMISHMPVKVILNSKHPLLGCGNYLNIHCGKEAVTA
jgi:glucokinase